MASKVKSKIFLIDFEDSFTYNIVAEIFSRGQMVEVIPYALFSTWKKTIQFKETQYYQIIWGPGPGHPEDYLDVLSVMSKWLDKKNIFHWGICLGHQMLMYTLGFRVKRCRYPIHGQNFSFTIPKWSCFPKIYQNKIAKVQRYNSLVPFIRKEVIKLLKNSRKGQYVFRDKEIWAYYDRQIISYQFHPESVGTSTKDAFFWPLLNFSYNRRDGTQTTPLRRSL